MKTFKIEQYHPDPDEGAVRMTEPVFIMAETSEDAHRFGRRVLGVVKQEQLTLSPFAGRLPADAVVLHTRMTIEEAWTMSNEIVVPTAACG